MEHLKQQLEHTDLMPQKPTTPPPANGIEAAKRRAESPEFRPTHEHSTRRATFLAAAVIVPVLAITGAGIYAVTQLGEPRTTIQPATGTSPTSPTGAPTFNSDGTYTFQGHDITFATMTPPPGQVRAVVESPNQTTGHMPTIVNFVGDPNWRYKAYVGGGYTHTGNINDLLSSGQVMQVKRMPAQGDPNPVASIAPDEWKSLAAGAEHQNQELTKKLDRYDRNERLFDYAKSTLSEVVESAETRRNALVTLSRIGVTVQPSEREGKPTLIINYMSATPSPGSSGNTPNSASFELDLATGLALGGPTISTHDMNEVPPALLIIFNKAQEANDGRCRTSGSETTCDILQ